ncbi:MAG TPA: DUF2631 domain-containing protein [Mycobacterium sp.]|nr:DUF2631 domain-containing protein [Mycobacterium sp.]
MAGTELERDDRIDMAEVPSANWGWSRIHHRIWHISGLGIFGFLLLMLRGNHVGHVEDYFLIAFAVLVLVVLVRDIIGRKRGWIK